MNQGQLSPPVRVFQGIVVFLVAPAVLWCICWLRMGELQRMYFGSFVTVSLVPGGEGWFSHKVRSHPRTLYCVDQDTPAIAGMDTQDLRPVVFPMTTAAYRDWLERFIYRGRLWAYLKRSVVLSLLLIVPLFVGAWKMDRIRHLKFRSTPRHLRGSQLITRSQFRKRVRGDGSCWLMWKVFPKKARPSGMGWRTEGFTEEV